MEEHGTATGVIVNSFSEACDEHRREGGYMDYGFIDGARAVSTLQGQRSGLAIKFDTTAELNGVPYTRANILKGGSLQDRAKKLLDAKVTCTFTEGDQAKGAAAVIDFTPL